jgi:hypothetical protein
MPRPIDRSNPANALVIADETVYFNNIPGVWWRITATTLSFQNNDPHFLRFRTGANPGSDKNPRIRRTEFIPG